MRKAKVKELRVGDRVLFGTTVVRVDRISRHNLYTPTGSEQYLYISFDDGSYGGWDPGEELTVWDPRCE